MINVGPQYQYTVLDAIDYGVAVMYASVSKKMVSPCEEFKTGQEIF
jgi:hypothetical protein